MAAIMTNVSATGANILSEASAEVILLQNIYWIVLNLFYLATVLGIPGNTMSFIITMQKDNRKISTSVYMSALAVVDTLTFLTGDAIGIVSAVPSARKLLGNHVGQFIKINWFLGYTFAIISGFYLMEMSIDRLIVVRFPMAASRLCTTARAKVTVILTLVIAFGLGSNFMFIYDYTYDPVSGVNGVEPNVPNNASLEMFGSMFQLFFGTLLPFIVIVFINVWIIITVKGASQKHKQLSGSATTSGDAKRKQETSHLTRMLIIVSCAYVVCSIPMRMYEMMFDLPALKAIYDFSDAYWFVRYKVGYVFLGDLWILNFGINFYLYCIGGKKFRNDAIKILKRCLPCKVH